MMIWFYTVDNNGLSLVDNVKTPTLSTPNCMTQQHSSSTTPNCGSITELYLVSYINEIMIGAKR
jgi:hypothetical protein